MLKFEANPQYSNSVFPTCPQVENLETSYMLTHQYLDFTSMATMFKPADDGGLPDHTAQERDRWAQRLKVA